MNENKIFFGKSINNNECIGPCFEKGSILIDPLTLNIIEAKENLCPIGFYNNINENLEECNKVSKNIRKEDYYKSYLYPYFKFNHRDFLKRYYNIDTYDNFYLWMKDNEKINLNTKSRIIECALIELYNENIIDNIIVDFFEEYIREKYKKVIYDIYIKYIKINNGIIRISKKEEKNKIENEKYYNEIINFLLDTLFNKNEIRKFLVKYQENKKIIKCFNLINKIINDLFEHIENKIKITD